MQANLFAETEALMEKLSSTTWNPKKNTVVDLENPKKPEEQTVVAHENTKKPAEKTVVAQWAPIEKPTEEPSENKKCD